MSASPWPFQITLRRPRARVVAIVAVALITVAGCAAMVAWVLWGGA